MDRRAILAEADGFGRRDRAASKSLLGQIHRLGIDLWLWGGDQIVQITTDGLLGRIAKERFGSGVPLQNAVLGIEGHDGIGGAGQYVLQIAAALLDLPLQSLAGGDFGPSLLVQTAVLDSNRGVAGKEHQEIAVLLAENAVRGKIHHIDDADDLSLPDHRHRQDSSERTLLFKGGRPPRPGAIIVNDQWPANLGDGTRRTLAYLQHHTPIVADCVMADHAAHLLLLRLIEVQAAGRRVEQVGRPFDDRFQEEGQVVGRGEVQHRCL